MEAETGKLYYTNIFSYFTLSFSQVLADIEIFFLTDAIGITKFKLTLDTEFQHLIVSDTTQHPS